METTEARWRRALFPSLLLVFVVGYTWRLSGLLPVAPLTNHLSIFYLTGAALTLLSGPNAFVDPSLRRRALLFAALLGAVNVAAEMLLALGDIDTAVNRAMGDVNTTYPVDGLFGLAAVALVVLLLPPRRSKDSVVPDDDLPSEWRV